LPAAAAGGNEAALIGLTHALGQLTDGCEEYVIIGPWEDPHWLGPYLGPNQRVVRGPKPSKARVGRIPRPARYLALRSRRLVVQLMGTSRVWPEVPVSNGFYESLRCDVVHFPYQQFVLCALPTVYNPHDLQHVHYPQFFKPTAIAWRETIYRAGCHFSQTVVAGCQWVKDDIVEHYGVSPQKVQVIPWAPPTQAYPEPTHDTLMAVRGKYQLDQPFALYPSVTWEHKNHIRLLEAIALLRDRHGLIVHLVCTGHKNDFWPRIEQRFLELDLSEQVRFLGVVPGEELRALYRLAQFVVIPSLFEAVSGPLFEAWQEGAPAACSTVTSLPEQAADAALLFDPLSVEAIADALATMSTKPGLREDLVKKGARRLQDFSWERTARAYRAVYRRAGGHPLSEEDRWLLGWDWMRQPRREQGQPE